MALTDVHAAEPIADDEDGEKQVSQPGAHRWRRGQKRPKRSWLAVMLAHPEGFEPPTF